MSLAVSQSSEPLRFDSLGSLDHEGLLAIARCFERGQEVHASFCSVNCYNYPRSFIRSFFSSDSDRRLAQVFIRTVRARQGESIPANSNDLSLEVAKRFVKSGVLPATDSNIVALRKELNAARLGISADVFDANPGFLEFAQKSHLHRYLLHFGHTLRVNPDKTVSLLRTGVLTPWSEIAPTVRFDRNYWTGQYTQTGVETKSRFDWEEFKPYKTGNPDDWGNQYAMKIIIWRAGRPSLTGEPFPPYARPDFSAAHTYFHLMTPEQNNNIYSAGFYRPFKHVEEGLSRIAFPCRMRKGSIMVPDESDAWGGQFISLTFAITPHDFALMKGQVERDHAADKHPYHLASRNCNQYTLDLATIGGANLPSIIHMIDLFTYIPEETARKFPSVVKEAGSAVATVAMNTLCASVLGGQRVDPDANGHRGPQIASFGDIFDRSKAEFSHHFMLERVFKKIESWREAEIAPLQAQLPGAEPAKAAEINAEIKRIRFAFPEEYVADL